MGIKPLAIFSLCASFIVPNQSEAQDAPVLITYSVPGPTPSPPGQHLQTWTAGFNLNALKQIPKSIVVNLPNRTPFSADLVNFEARAGYLFDVGITPDPDASPNDFSYRWYGRSEDWVVALTVEKGVLAGRVTGRSNRFSIAPRENALTEVGLINPDYWRLHIGQSNRTTSGKAVHDESESQRPQNADGGLSVGNWDPACPGSAPQGQNVVDVAVMYTPITSFSFGGAAGVKAVVQGAIDDANQSLRNSRIHSFRFWLRATEPVPDTFVYEDARIDRALEQFGGWHPIDTKPYLAFPGNAAVLARRNALEADIMVLARTPLNNADCGASYIQHTRTDGYVREPGPSFEKFAYVVFNPECGPDKLNLPHELGHQLGMEHDPRNSDFAAGTISGSPSCPWSYGHRRGSTNASDPLNFRTVMSYDSFGNSTVPGTPCIGPEYCPQIDAYSTPAAEWTGTVILPTGSVAGSPPIGVATATSALYAARADDTMARLAPIVENFRQRSNLIFADAFQ